MSVGVTGVIRKYQYYPSGSYIDPFKVSVRGEPPLKWHKRLDWSNLRDSQPGGREPYHNSSGGNTRRGYRDYRPIPLVRQTNFHLRSSISINEPLTRPYIFFSSGNLKLKFRHLHLPMALKILVTILFPGCFPIRVA